MSDFHKAANSDLEAELLLNPTFLVELRGFNLINAFKLIAIGLIGYLIEWLIDTIFKVVAYLRLV